MPDTPAAALRGFSRFYTQRLGLLDRELLASGHSLAASRVLWELAHDAPRSAATLCRELGLDAGYMSRLLRRLREDGLVTARRDPADARSQALALTAAGRRAFAKLDAASQAQASALLAPLAPPSQQQLAGALDVARQLLEPPAARAAPQLDTLQPGDLGWVAERHGALYAQEYGFDMRFEALVARIAADFVDRLDPTCERAWIARSGTARLGCVFCVRADAAEFGPGLAQLRLLLVEPAARGLGLGDRLVGACEAFARERGYRGMVLWTNANLDAARAIYRRRGWTLVRSEAHHSFGRDLVGEIWTLGFDAALTPAAGTSPGS